MHDDASKGWMLNLLTAFSCVAVGAAAVLLMVEILHVCMMVYLHIAFPLLVIEVYMILFAIVVILTELELGSQIRKTLMFHSWVFRGLYYIFYGVVEYYIHEEDSTSLTAIVVERAGLVMGIVGGIYLLMGLLYLKKIRECTNISLTISLNSQCNVFVCPGDDKIARYVQLLSFSEVGLISAQRQLLD